ncbi:ATP-dependent RNA helicase DHX30 [Lasioglossum baleicum]|uniref:ATP-dependent RNA helicase DHX30 n=1 Tax=Lasioglossum baleicum TaxID=434251 RepID=UPI003FCD12C2
MFRVQVISILKKPICSYLRIHHKRELYRTSLKNIQLYSRALYCSYNKNPCVSTDSTDYEKLEVDTDNANIQQFEKEHLHGRRNKTSITKISKERLNKLFENPVGHLQSIYLIVNNEFGKKDHITFQYENVHDMSTKMYKCTINVSWPEELSFSHIGPNKKAAATHASKKCLTWLYNNGYLKNLKPVLYNQEEIEDMLFEPNRINLESKFEDDVQGVLDTFSNDIEPIIKGSSDIIDVENKLVEPMYSPRKSFQNDEMRSDSLYRKLQNRTRSAQNLPILEHKSEILKSIDENQILLIKGDTGCGKSTQVPQFIMDAYTAASRGHECNILVSEPRKISAVSLANRIAHEREEVVGEVVGFHVRLNHMLPPTNGSILFCTTGIILRRLQSNPTLEGISHIIIDEAHERTLQIDILLNLMKKLLTTKPDLKLIIMSATVNTELFQQYFSCAAIEIPGKMYPVKMHFLEDIESEIGIKCEKSYQDWEIPSHEILQLIHWITETKPPGSILCFVPGWREIQYLQDMLQNRRNSNLLILPFHSKLTNAEQEKVFCEVPDHVRKIILATDIAESSITIPDVKYVIDTARKRDIVWNEDSSLYTVFTHWVTKANILQRKGRAGRVSPGESYHILKKSMYDGLDSFPEPEIRRISLDQAVVTSKTFSDETAEDFFNSMIDRPSKKSLTRAVEYLKRHNVLDEDEKLTPLGKRMMYFSLDVKLSKALLLSCVFHCLNPLLTITTMLSTDNESSATSLIGKADKKDQKSKYHNSSDHIGMSDMYKGMNQYYNDMSERINYRSSHYKNYKKISVTRELYLNELIQTDMVSSVEDCQLVNVHSKQMELIRAVLFAATNQLIRTFPGGYKNGYFTKTTNSIKAEDSGNVAISPESVNSKRKVWPSPFLTYVTRVEHVESRRCLVSDTSLISPLSVLLFSHGDITCSKLTENDIDGDDKVLIAIDNLRNVQLSSDERSAALLLQLRSVLWDVVNYTIKYQSVESESENLKNVMLFKHRLLNVILNIINESANSIDKSAKEASSKRLRKPNSYASHINRI